MVFPEQRLCRTSWRNCSLLQKKIRYWVWCQKADACNCRRQWSNWPCFQDIAWSGWWGYHSRTFICLLRTAYGDGRRRACYYQHKNEDNFRLKASDLRAAITPKTKLLVLPFPNNPTGAIMEREDLEEIAEVIKEHNILSFRTKFIVSLHTAIRTMFQLLKSTVCMSAPLL